MVTIGVFDGVHRGHQALVGQAVQEAAESGERSMALTFFPNPVEVVRPGSAPRRLCSLQRRVELLAACGVDAVEVLDFNEAMAAMSAQDFTRVILQDRLNAARVVVGSGFRFGNRAAGTAETLREQGLDVVEVGLIADGEPVSSTRIRGAVAEGDMAAAAAMLGRPHEVEGVVVRGHSRGRELGFPTANVDHDPLAAVPADGVYAGHAMLADTSHPAAISIGTNPTFGATERTVEAYLLDFDDDLYGRPMRVTFEQRLRPTLAFESTAALIDQMHADVEDTRRIVG